MRREWSLPAAVALGWGLVVAVASYAIVRAVQCIVAPDPNPAAAVWSAHAGYFWRVATVCYAGGNAAFITFLLARRQPQKFARALPRAVGISASLLALQATFFP